MEGRPVIEQIYSIEANNFTLAGEASSAIKKLLRQLGVPSDIVRRMAIAAYEMEMNLVIHSIGGELILQVTPDKIHLLSNDLGPGIPNIDLAMQEGYSTAPESARELGFGAGMGLSNIKRCADNFCIKSKMGQGTSVEIRINL